jgi:hypothetical protein
MRYFRRASEVIYRGAATTHVPNGDGTTIAAAD